jgi:uncharacterized protein (TIGR02466 family)
MKVYHNFIFPSLLTEVECVEYEGIKDELINEIYQYQSQTDTVNYSNRGGWQSPSYFFNHVNSSNQNPLFDKIRDYIFPHLNNGIPYQWNFELINMWININQKGNYNVCHCHPSSLLSGVFWIKIPENSGNLEFINPNNYQEGLLTDTLPNDVATKHNFFNTLIVSPREGSLIIFPSHIFHNVTENKCDEDRISIAFNLRS